MAVVKVGDAPSGYGSFRMQCDLGSDFIKLPIGNIYEVSSRTLLERLCSNDVCGCHIDYVHLDELAFYSVFGKGVIERIPAELTSHRKQLAS